MAPTILFQDDHLLAVDKPAGLPVQPDRSGDPSLLDAVQALSPGAHLVHRIDRPVSGVVVFALTREVAAILGELFRDQRLEKVYWAIVHGKVEGEKEWRHWLMGDQRVRKSRRVAEGSEGAQEARVKVRPLAIGDRYTLIELRPDQGRFHQLRAQCAAAGHAIKGDVKYGARRGEKDRSIALHARSIAFAHPATRQPLTIMAPAPSSPLWNGLLNIAGAAAFEAGT